MPSRNENGTESGDNVSTGELVNSLEMRSNADHKDSGSTLKCKDVTYCGKQGDDVAQLKEKNNIKHQNSPSLGRLVKLSLPDGLYAILGSIGASILGSFRPILAYVVGLILTAYYRTDGSHFDVDKWCLIIVCMAIVVLVASVLQHFYFGIMGEKMTERIRRMMFSGNILFFLFFFIYFYRAN